MKNFLFLVLLLMSHHLWAQNTGKIVGIVTSEDSRPLFLVNLVLDNQSGTTTGQDGTFSFAGLAPGGYQVTASMVGYLPVTKKVSVSDGQTATLTFILKESLDALDDVVVLGQRKQIVSATRSSMELIDIPMSVQLVDRQVIKQQQIINLREVFRNVSGIQNTAAWGNGSRRLEVSARGFLLTDANYRRNGLLISNEGNHFSDHIEEVQVLKGPASVLYGDVSPGGSDQFCYQKAQAI